MTEDLRSGDRWVGEAPAKVNLYLRIGEQEPSGYHRLETLFQALELSDTVVVERLDPGDAGADGPPVIDFILRGVTAGELGPSDRNLAVRAARRFQEEIALRGMTPPDLRVELEKRIPHGAGLGGGSSDAASVLRGANAASGNLLSIEDLTRIGGELGSDVPFFLCGSSLALGAGRGEILSPLPPLPMREVLLLVPSEGIATGWAYGVLAESRRKEGLEMDAAPALEATPGSAGDFHVSAGASEVAGDVGVGAPLTWEGVMAEARNDFESVLFPLRPELQRWKDLLTDHRAGPALLSGSGSVLFGVFSDQGALDAARREAEGAGLMTLHTRTRI